MKFTFYRRKLLQNLSGLTALNYCPILNYANIIIVQQTSLKNGTIVFELGFMEDKTRNSVVVNSE